MKEATIRCCGLGAQRVQASVTRTNFRSFHNHSRWVQTSCHLWVCVVSNRATNSLCCSAVSNRRSKSTCSTICLLPGRARPCFSTCKDGITHSRKIITCRNTGRTPALLQLPLQNTDDLAPKESKTNRKEGLELYRRWWTDDCNVSEFYNDGTADFAYGVKEFSIAEFLT